MVNSVNCAHVMNLYFLECSYEGRCVYQGDISNQGVYCNALAVVRPVGEVLPKVVKDEIPKCSGQCANCANNLKIS